MISVATAMLVDMVGEAGGLELAVLIGGAVLRVLLGGVARLGCSSGSQQYRVSGPVAIDGVRGFVSFGVDPTAFGVPSWDVPTTALVATLAMLAYSRFVGDGWSLMGIVDVDSPSRFASTPSSARCRCRKASFSHEFMTSWVAVSKPCREGLAV